MEKTLRRLAVLATLVAVLAGIEYFTALDVPGFDPGTVQREVAETVEVPEGALPDDLSFLPDLPSVDFSGSEPAPRPSPAERTVEGPHVRAVSWNLYNWGRTKDDQEIEVAAETLRDVDLVAVQEVVTSPPGTRAIGKLDAALDRTGFEWDYRLSDPTTGDGTERYAVLWKPSRVRPVGQARLASSLAGPIDREPYLGPLRTPNDGTAPPGGQPPRRSKFQEPGARGRPARPTPPRV
jgi:hypothetical protein